MLGSFVRNYVKQPQQLWLRRAMFQIHLWVGLFLVVYSVLIGVSGSILVFRQEFLRWGGLNPNYGTIEPTGPQLSFAEAAAVLKEKYPKGRIGLLYPPRRDHPVYFANVSVDRQPRAMGVHPYTGEIVLDEQPKDNWVLFFARMHFTLLLGREGAVLNGIGSFLLVARCVSGIFIWWPGIKQWVRAFVVDFRKNWKRVNWDLHNVVGFWTLLFMLMWGVTGVYLIWPQEFIKAVHAVSPVTLAAARSARYQAEPNPSGAMQDLNAIVSTVATSQPGKHIGAIAFPARDRAPLTFYMVDDGKETLAGADHVFYDPGTGKFLGLANRSKPQTVGDWFIWLQAPLHYGTQWGLAVKIIWFVIGLALPLLAVTGLLMYWNRYLSKKWKKLRALAARPRATLSRTGGLPVAGTFADSDR